MKKIRDYFNNPKRYLLWAIYLLLLVFAIAKVGENGDFIGYTNAGNLVIEKGDIYSDMFNTWPPAFSILAVPLAIINNFSFILVRVLWMIFMFYCFFFCIKSCLELLDKTKYTFREIVTKVLSEPYYLLALFLACRSFMDNIIYMQINVVMLASCCYFMRDMDKRPLASSLLLGLSIGAKVYNIMLLPVIILFRKWRSAIHVSIGIIITFILSFIVFGFEKGLHFYHHWYTVIASVKQTIVHRNQSLIAGLIRLFTGENLVINQTRPVTELSNAAIQFIFISILGACLLLYLKLFWKHLKLANPDFVFHSMILVLTMIPVLTPVSWKANYIYGLPAFFFICHSMKCGFSNGPIRYSFLISVLLLCLSNEAIIGREAMYFLETWNVLIVGQILLFAVLLLQMQALDKRGYYN